MPATDMTEVSEDFPFGLGMKECTSCRTITSAQVKAALYMTKPTKKPNSKRQFKQYMKRLERDLQRKSISDGGKPIPAGMRLDFYDSPAWKSVRYDALARADGKCQLCGASKATGATLHVDHIKPRSRFPALALVITNLQVLCEPCNMGKGNRDTKDWRR